MIDVTMDEGTVLDLPLREAMTMLATVLWVIRAGEDRTFRLEQAWDLSLGEALAALEVAQSPKG